MLHNGTDTWRGKCANIRLTLGAEDMVYNDIGGGGGYVQQGHLKQSSLTKLHKCITFPHNCIIMGCQILEGVTIIFTLQLSAS